MALPSEVFRERLREVRRLKGWTQQQLADVLTDAGLKLDATAVTRLERGTRGVALDEVVAIAAALGVSPLHLIVPLHNDELLNVDPQLSTDAVTARAWIRGQQPLRETDDDKWFYSQMPYNDWDSIEVGVAYRFESRQDYLAARAQLEHRRFRQMVTDGFLEASRGDRVGHVKDYDAATDTWIEHEEGQQ
jgi:transcriptional regulator with XRE-family HTH domain